MSLPSTINELLMGSTAASYTISNSLRFRSSASAYLNRTPSVAGSQTTFTFSAWVKRGSLGGSGAGILYSGAFASSNDSTGIQFRGDDTLQIFQNSGSTTVLNKITTQVFRDPSAWYHLVITFDTTNATAEDRVRIYINGVRVTAFSTNTNIPQNTNTYYNSTSYGNRIFRDWSTNYLDGYLTEINFIDGQALTPSSFGETDSTTGVWKAKKYAGSYGTNGFYLKFNNGSSTTTLGYDSSGNSNNWTTNNISLTSGSTYDWMTDSPTPASSTVGNYAVLNPLNPPLAASISNANLTYTRSSPGGVGAATGATGTFAMSSGKWYFELLFTAVSSDGTSTGTLDDNFGIISIFAPNNIGGDYFSYNQCWIYCGNGQKANGTRSTYGSTLSVGDVIGVAVDMDSGKIWFSKNGTWQASGDPAAGTNEAFSNLVGKSVTPLVATYHNLSGGDRVRNLNAGQRPFAYTPPTGFKALNTYNLPTPTINKGNQYFDATAYTGTGATQSITNSGFQPDFVWLKSRSNARDHRAIDSVRGINNVLTVNSAASEYTGSALSSLNSNGFTLNTSDNQNVSAETYIGWQWKAGGTAVTNTNGSISSQVSVNPTAGFSIMTHTGTGSSGTIGHGLGVAPSMVITKMRSPLSTEAWTTWHTGLSGGTYYVYLQSSQAQASNSAKFSATPTSTVINVGNDDSTNRSGSPYVSYCFAAVSGYSAFGSYTGNGSADGPFVYCGFRPRYVMVKCSSSDQAGNADWRIQDSARDPYNVVGNILFADLSNAESTGNALMDILSNGFKLRGTSTGQNASGATYIYAAFAENPFQYSLAR